MPEPPARPAPIFRATIGGHVYQGNLLPRVDLPADPPVPPPGAVRRVGVRVTGIYRGIIPSPRRYPFRAIDETKGHDP